MADRTLISYQEPRLEHGPYWRLRIERSAAGAPRGLVIIEFASFDGTLPDEEMCVVLDDLRILQPALDWANR